MIARTIKCDNCKKDIFEKFTNEEYSEYIQKLKRLEKKAIGSDKKVGFVCEDCGKKMFGLSKG